MTSGIRAECGNGALPPILCACLLALSCLNQVHAIQENRATLMELMSKLSEVRAAHGRFTEQKFLSILNEPLVLTGTVQYRAPDFVRKEYDDADSESYEVHGDSLIIELPDGRRRDLSVDQHPVLRAFVESYRGTLAGDLVTLERYFDVELSGDIQSWALRLTPRTRELGEYLSAVIMRGSEATIRIVETLEASGDRSVMKVDPGSE